MEKLEVGKLYLLCATQAMFPFNVLFGVKNPSDYRDPEAKEIMISNKTLGIYLGMLAVDAVVFDYSPAFKEIYYYKFLIDDQILYILDDGCSTFERVTNDPCIL